ncbi:MAG: glycosyltransferase family 2 protein [Brevinema sp.]
MNNPNPLISIIIPVYNTESFLQKCLDSAVNQTYKNIEIIVVNDGSSGNCKEICSQYPEIKYLSHSKNMGLFAARETGARSAEGEYIITLDADDWLELNACKHISAEISHNHSDIIMIGSKRFLPKNTLYRESFIADQPLLDYFTTEKKDTHLFLWQLVVKRNILISIYDDLSLSQRFILSEDVLHFYTILYYAKTWTTVTQHCYCYNESNLSATRKRLDTATALRDLNYMSILFSKLEEFRVSKDLPEGIFEAVKERQFNDRMRDMSYSYSDLDADVILPKIIEIFGYKMIQKSLFDINCTPSMTVPQRKMSSLLIKLQNKILPEGSFLFNILQSMWWKMK